MVVAMALLKSIRVHAYDNFAIYFCKIQIVKYERYYRANDTGKVLKLFVE